MTSSGAIATVVDMRNTTYLRDIMDLDLLADMLAQGFVRKQVHPDDDSLWILNYTEKAQFEKVWNEVTLQCRGLIIRASEDSSVHPDVVVARPFKKFFNLNENPFPEPIQYDPTARVEVTDKMDGSLGILYMDPDGLPAIATRGSFTSEQALHATRVYRERYYNQWHPSDGSTYLFEIIYPENRIVLDYGPTDDLVLIGEVVTATGALNSPKAAALLDGWPGPVTQVFNVSTLAEALQLADRENAEGLVVRYVYGSDPKMVKIKQDDYVALHKVIFGLNERAIWERLLEEDAADILASVPEEFHDWVSDVHARLMHEMEQIFHTATGEYWAIQNSMNWEDDRKEFARRAQERTYPKLLFMLLDGKDPWPLMHKMIKPEHVTFAHSGANQIGANA